MGRMQLPRMSHEDGTKAPCGRTRRSLRVDPWTHRRNLTLILSAILAGLCPLVGNGLYAGPQGDGQAILDEIQSGIPVIAYIAYPLELVGFISMAVVLGWLVVNLQRHAPVAGAAAGILGASMLAVKVGSLAPGMAVQTQGAVVDPATVELVSSLGDQDFVVSGFLFCAAFAAAGFGLVQTSMRRWLAWWPAVAGVAGVVAGMVGVVRPGGVRAHSVLCSCCFG